MKTVILIGGQLATGKTTLANYISEKLSIPCFIKDRYKETLADTIGFTNREENKKLSVAVFNIFLNISKQFISVNMDLIIESNFKQNEIDELKELFEKNGYKIYSIVLSGNDDILYERYLNRFKFEHRHPAHANFNSKEEFNEYNSMLKNVRYFGQIKEYNCDQFVDANLVISDIKFWYFNC